MSLYTDGWATPEEQEMLDRMNENTEQWEEDKKDLIIVFSCAIAILLAAIIFMIWG